MGSFFSSPAVETKHEPDKSHIRRVNPRVMKGYSPEPDNCYIQKVNARVMKDYSPAVETKHEPDKSHIRRDNPRVMKGYSPEPDNSYIQKDNPWVLKGYLEKLKDVDIIVNSTDKSLELSQGGDISNIISRIGGAEIQKELNEYYPGGIEPGEVAVTNGYNLSYEYVYHCSLQNIEERISHHEIREVISACLEKAKDQCPNSSIAFPAIGTGRMNFPPRILKTIYCKILEFLEENPSITVYIIIHPSKTDLIDYMKKIDRKEELERLTYPVTFPTTWVQTDDIKRIKVTKRDEYQFVKDKFEKTIIKSVKILKIERIENKRLFIAYERYKNSLRNGKSTEKLLWHGTKEKCIDSIARYGFDWRLTDRAVWGKGCYFAKNASYSDQDGYAVPNSRNEKFMFLTYVVAGEAIVGDQRITEWNIPSNIQSTTNKDHTIYITYNDDQQYPAFVVVYKHT